MDYKFEISALIFLVYPAVTDKVLRLGVDHCCLLAPQHLKLCLDYCENKFDNIDAVMAIFGTPGLVTMFEMYDVLHEAMQTCRKPIFPILPSINTAGVQYSK